MNFHAIYQVSRDPLIFMQDHITFTIMGVVEDDENSRLSFRAMRNDSMPVTAEDMSAARSACAFIMEPIYGPEQ